MLKEYCENYVARKEWLVEVYAMKDYIHMLLLIPTKFNVENTLEFLKGKSAIRIFGDYM